MINILIVILLLLAQSAFAADQTSTDCTHEAVQTAINNTTDGSTCTIKAGSCTWDTAVTMNKAIRLTAQTGTVITNASAVSWSSGAILTSNYSGSGERKIDGFTITGRGTGGNSPSIKVEGSTRIHVTNMTFLNQSIAMYLVAPPNSGYGLINYNSFQAGTANAELIQPSSSNPATEWTQENYQGTEHAWYIENNTFTKTSTGTVSGHCVAGNRGARIVFRNNTVEDMDFDAHGTCSTALSTRWYEVYNNTWKLNSGKSMYRWMYIRGGTGIIYSNYMTDSGTLTLETINLQEQQLYYPANCACWTGGYPALHQIGMGQNDTLSPLWMWDNKVDGVVKGVTVDTGSGCGLDITGDFIRSGTEYYINAGAKPGYTALGTHTLAGGVADTTAAELTVTSPETTITCSTDPMSISEQVTSNEAATVRVATSAEYAGGDDTYDEMNTTLTGSGGTTHYRTVSRSCGASYTVWFASVNLAGLKSTPISTTYTIGAAAGAFESGTRFGENSTADVSGVMTDTNLNLGTPTVGYPSSSVLELYTYLDATPAETIIIKADLSSIPTDATVTGAWLYLYQYGTGGDASYEVTAHKITGDNPTITEATWNVSATGNNWTTTGGGLGDVAAEEVAVICNSTSGWKEFAIPLMVADWVATPANNKGLLIASDQGENTATADSYRDFRSSNHTDASLRPFLVVAYTIPDPGTPGESAKTINLTGGTLTVKPSGGSLTITW